MLVEQKLNCIFWGRWIWWETNDGCRFAECAELLNRQYNITLVGLFVVCVMSVFVFVMNIWLMLDGCSRGSCVLYRKSIISKFHQFRHEILWKNAAYGTHADDHRIICAHQTQFFLNSQHIHSYISKAMMPLPLPPMPPLLRSICPIQIYGRTFSIHLIEPFSECIYSIDNLMEKKPFKRLLLITSQQTMSQSNWRIENVVLVCHT